MWVDTATGTYPIFHIETSRIGYVPKPYGLDSESETGGVKLQWTGTTVADKYYIYRDNVKVGETTSKILTSWQASCCSLCRQGMEGLSKREDCAGFCTEI